MQKPSRRRSSSERRKVTGKPCLVCGLPSDACHIRSRGAGGGDEKWNLVPLCREHHQMQHKAGWWEMARRCWTVEVALDERGWRFDCSTGLVRLVRK